MLSLVIPTYNERHNIAPFIQEVMLALEKTTASFEIIIVDDNSPDGTWQVAEELARANPHLRVVRRRGERGLATAVVAGWRAARGELLGVMDGDFQHSPEALPKLLDRALRMHADIVVASRHIAEGPGSGSGAWPAAWYRGAPPSSPPCSSRGFYGKCGIRCPGFFSSDSPCSRASACGPHRV
jgi:glycosyltransferase involved in cell wall biosynthesis